MRRSTEHGTRITGVLLLTALVAFAQDPKKPKPAADTPLKPKRAFMADGLFGPGVLLPDGKTYVCPYAVDVADPMDLLVIDLGAGTAKRCGPKEKWATLGAVGADRLGAILGEPPQQQALRLKADGTEPQPAVALPVGAAGARIAPSGDKIAVVVFDTKFVIKLVEPTGGDPVPVTDAVDADSEPLWSPDSKRLAYLRRVGAKTEVWKVTVGAGASLVTGEYESASHVAWAPDSQRLAFVAGGNALAIADADAGKLVVWKGEGPLGPPAWTPAGDAVLVREERAGKAGFTVVSADGKTARKFKLEPAPGAEYAWATDGSVVYRLGRRDGAIHLWVVEVPK